MKLGVVTALWGREQITRLCLRRIARAAAGRDVELVAVTDEPVNGATARELGWRVFAHPNEPLSDKFNAGARALRDQVDAIVVLGSDDWVCDRFFGHWAALLAQAPVVGVVDFWQVAVPSLHTVYYPGYTKPGRRGESLGAGRGLRADVLDALDWQPWPPGLPRGLDGGMRTLLRQSGFDALGRPQDDLGVRVLGVKGADVLTPFDRFLQVPGGRYAQRTQALSAFPVDECRDLEALALEQSSIT